MRNIIIARYRRDLGGIKLKRTFGNGPGNEISFSEEEEENRAVKIRPGIVLKRDKTFNYYYYNYCFVMNIYASSRSRRFISR